MSYLLDDGRTTEKRIAWWEEKRDVHELVFSQIKAIRDDSSARRQNDRKHMLLYGNLDAVGKGISVINQNDRLSYNLIAEAVDTAASLVAQNRPKPTYLTDGGDWSLQRSAKMREKLISAQFRELKAYKLAQQAFVDAGVLGTGVLKGYVDSRTKKPVLERVLPLELHVDHQDGLSGSPRSLYQTKLYAREVLQRMFPKADLRRETVPRYSGPGDDAYEFFLDQNSQVDQVLAVEGWHLPSSPGAKDGKHVFCVQGADLFAGPWDWSGFPFVFYRWKERQAGFWGCGIAEEIRSDQIHLNRLLIKLQQIINLNGCAYVFLPSGSRVKPSQITNTPMTVIEFVGGVPPVFQSVNAVPEELFLEIDRTRDRALERLGISKHAAEATKPAGLNSAPALRAHAHLTSQRQVIQSQRYDEFFMDLARLLEYLNEESVKSGGDVTAISKEKRGVRSVMEKIDWKQAKLPENQYMIDVYSASSLPADPPGRIATIQEWFASGWIDSKTAKRLADLPDIESHMALENADEDYVLFAVETMIEDGKYVPPEPFLNLELAKELVRRSLNRASVDGVPEERLQLLRDYVEQVDAMVLEIMQSQAAAQAPAGGPETPPVAPESPPEGGEPSLAA